MFWRKKKTAAPAVSLAATPRPRSLAEGAARFAAIARSAHGRPEDNGQVCTSPDHCSSAISPDEIWARQFMTQGIGPLTDSLTMAKMPPMQSSFALQSFSLDTSGTLQAKTVEQHPASSQAFAEQVAGPYSELPQASQKSGPMGAQIGRKPGR